MEGKMKLIRNIFVVLATLLFSVNLANAGEKWDMALAYGAGNFHSANATEFAKNVTDKSGGKLTIVTHPGGSLFKGGEIFRAVRTGQAPIGERFMSALGKEDPLLEVDSQPFLATNYGAAMRLYQSSKPEIVKGLDAKGLVFLYAVPWPAQGLYSKKEINSVADLKGLKFRAYNTATIRIAELTGMAPTKIEAAEISQAFSTGAVESMITSPTTGKNKKIWENGVGYFYDIAAWFPKNMVIANKDAWNKLDADTQKLIMSEAAKAEQKGWDLSKKGNRDDKKALADAGMKVGKVNATLKKHFEGVGATMSKEWADRAGARGQAVLAAYK
jgi:TRAP-type C4-dicarboxylate transport system substrate-binding protein